MELRVEGSGVCYYKRFSLAACLNGYPDLRSATSILELYFLVTFCDLCDICGNITGVIFVDILRSRHIFLYCHEWY